MVVRKEGNLKKIIFLITLMALPAEAAPTPFPVFLRTGFSSILEFPVAPTKVVLGDGQLFQVEKLERSLVIRALAPYASTNMFVYFKESDTRLFVLTASEDAEPTFYKKFDPPITPLTPAKATPNVASSKRGGRVVSSKFDEKKDFLTVEIEVSADGKERLTPNWNWVRLTYGSNAIAPSKVWAERKQVQKDARVKARMIFTKPNVPKNLSGVTLVVPLAGSLNPITLPLMGGAR